MKKITMLFFLFILGISFAQNEDSIEEFIDIEAINMQIDSINNSFTYQYNQIDINDGLATVHIPEGYKFLDAEQSKRVLSDVWGNPPSDDTLGMIFPEEAHPVGDSMIYAVEITYSDEGHIEDEDAKDIDYDDLLEEMQDDTNSYNDERIKLGYENIDLVGWASDPFYDEVNKKLHWAKELKFGESEINTLNYNIRVLGREGFLNLNVIGDMDALPQVKKDVNQILNSVEFNDGNKYSDFNPNIDRVAAYGIGGLIAGKVLAKAGAFALIAKFWKFIAIGAVALFSAFKNKIFGRKEEEEV
ncbi:DUF2167 domain-containing protein [Urechidicola croceus]|uniref:DUF2167 domain-containing protein n=1 Tax=Urechidicola croceus TaxID=1850246 RepID=A0A1D8PAW9_9FLAO|nr:DUF2167 domain-containing protein [Urechidicola croceus]AOW21705.1 hypothetical protein LPB138_13890 [Urechidicola croceus]